MSCFKDQESSICSLFFTITTHDDDEECGNTNDEDDEDGDDNESLKGGLHLTGAGVNDMKSFVILEKFQKTISSCVKFNRKCGFQNNLTGRMDLEEIEFYRRFF